MRFLTRKHLIAAALSVGATASLVVGLAVSASSSRTNDVRDDRKHHLGAVLKCIAG